jgi:CMP-N-acetylneuraminic acid synthetase
MLDVVHHVLSIFPYSFDKPDVVVLLQPTQPLRRPEHVREALRLLEETGADSVVSVVQIPAHYSPDYALINGHGRLEPWSERMLSLDDMSTRRQSASSAFSRDGTVYVTRREVIEAGSLYGDHCVPFVIPHDESVNIDTEEDWQRAEMLMRKRNAG